MLMQNFKSADELGITEPQRSALQKTLVLLETGKLVHHPIEDLGKIGGSFTGHFNMHTWARQHDCGTVACIGGTAEMIGDVVFNYGKSNLSLHELFEPPTIDWQNWERITPEQAARALRSYLTCGDAKWSEAIA